MLEKDVEELKDSRKSSTGKRTLLKRERERENTEGNSRREKQKQKIDQQYLAT